MRIAISGNSGFIGQHLTEFLSAGGDVVVPLKHAMFRSRSDEKLKQALTGCDVVINLAGATINQRWTRKAKRKIMNSRIYTTRRLVSIINEMEVKYLSPHQPSAFIRIVVFIRKAVRLWERVSCLMSVSVGKMRRRNCRETSGW